MARSWRVLLSVVVVVTVVAGAAGVGVLNAAAERDGAFTILRFDQQVTIAADGTTEVVEDLVVRFTAARRGIFRDLDARTEFPSSGGYEVLAVDRGADGDPWPYAVEWWASGPRVRIGEADRWLAPGDYRYRIRYRAPSWTYELADEPGTVEVRVDSPGFDWPTDVDAASLAVTVPGVVRGAACVEGPRGTTRVCAREPVVAGTTASFALGPYRDLQAATVALWFDADALTTPPPTHDPPSLGAAPGLGPWPLDRTSAALLLLALLAVPLAGWEALSARRVYRDRRTDRRLHDRQHPAALPLPPFGLPPADVAGLVQRVDGDALLLAALVDLDQRGLVRATAGSTKGGLFARDRPTLTLRPPAPEVTMHAGDAELVHHLVPDGTTTTFDGDYDATVATRVRQVQRVLTSRATGVFAVHGFLHDEGGLVARGWFRGVVALGALVYAGLSVLVVTAATPLHPAAAAGVVGLVVAGWLALRGLWRYHRLPLNSEGRDAVARARSFAEFVRTVEGDEIGWAAGQPGIDHHHPALSLLPYAIALGLADSWYERFGPVMAELAASAATSATSAGAAWWVTQSGYRGVSASHQGTSTAPSSSGGGGGGGGSGGGGGGGGSW